MFHAPLRQFVAGAVELALLEVAAAPLDRLDAAVASLGDAPEVPAFGEPEVSREVISHDHHHTTRTTIVVPVLGDPRALAWRPARRPLAAPRARVRLDSGRVVAVTTEADAPAVVAELLAWLEAYAAALGAEVAAAWPDARARVAAAAESRRLALELAS